MHIQVLGPGCAKCEEAKKLVEKTLQETGIKADVEKVSDLKEFMRLGVLSTPAIVIDGIVKCTGRVPTASELHQWMAAAQGGSADGKPEQAGKLPGSGGGCCCGGKC